MYILQQVNVRYHTYSQYYFVHTPICIDKVYIKTAHHVVEDIEVCLLGFIRFIGTSHSHLTIFLVDRPTHQQT